MKEFKATPAVPLNPRVMDFIEMQTELFLRDYRIKKLEELNAILVARVDELEAEKK